ncbi:hypothetical protein FS749_002393 [Ceratobasidium sp. UAMH 11750]|nr:hypothetical protein FS749_002393 [Ceratobasidium sp. UAMH 11750]
MGSGINPFDSQEAGPYKSDPQTTTMTALLVLISVEKSTKRNVFFEVRRYFPFLFALLMCH